MKNLIKILLFIFLVLAVCPSSYAKEEKTPAKKMTLNDCLNIAFQNNYNYKLSYLRVKEAEANLIQAKSQRAPKITTSLNYGYTYPTSKMHMPSYSSPIPLDPIKISPFTSSGLTVNIQFPLYSGGAITAAIDQALLNYQQKIKAYERSKIELIFQITDQFYNTLRAKNLVTVAAKGLQLAETYLDQTEKFFNAGTVAQYDVLRAKVQVADNRLRVLQAENTYLLSLSSLNNALGLPPSNPLNIEEEKTIFPVQKLSLEKLTQTAFASRLEIKEAEDFINIARALLEIAKSGKRPSLALTGAFQQYLTQPGISGTFNTLTAAFVANLTISDGGLTRGRIKQAESQIAQALVVFDQVKNGVALDVQQAYLNTKIAFQRIDTATVGVEQAKENLRVTQVRYEAGIAPIIDVMDAQNVLITANTNLVQAQYDFNVAIGQLAKAVGVGREDLVK